MQLTAEQKEAILKIADFLEERNREDRIYYDRVNYGFGWYNNDSRYHSSMYHNDTMLGFRDFYDRSRENENTFCKNSENFRDILKDAECLYSDSNFDTIWEDFITHLRNDGDFDNAIDYALMRSVVCYEKPDLYTLYEIAELLRDYIKNYDNYEHYDIEKILKDIVEEYSWYMRSDNYRLRKQIEGYEDAFNELENMLDEDED